MRGYPGWKTDLKFALGGLAIAIVALWCAACSDPVAPQPVPEPVPVLRFVGSCPHQAIWWLQVDGVNLAPTGIWLFTATDSLDFAPMPGHEQFIWTELDGNGFALQTGWGVLDAAGGARVEATCQ